MDINININGNKISFKDYIINDEEACRLAYLAYESVNSRQLSDTIIAMLEKDNPEAAAITNHEVREFYSYRFGGIKKAAEMFRNKIHANTTKHRKKNMHIKKEGNRVMKNTPKKSLQTLTYETLDLLPEKVKPCFMNFAGELFNGYNGSQEDNTNPHLFNTHTTAAH